MKLINAINKVRSRDVTRPSLKSLYLDGENQKIVATDGSIISILNPSEEIKESLCLDVPKISGKVLDVRLDDLTATNEAGLSVKCSKGHFNYPHWKGIIPEGTPTLEICLDAGLLLKLVESLTSSRDTRVKLSIISNKEAIKVSNVQTNNIGYIMPIYPESFEKSREKTIQSDY